MTESTPSVPSILVRGLARGVDLFVQLILLELAFRLSNYLPDQGLLTVADDWMIYVDVGAGLGALWVYTSVAEWLGGSTYGKFLTRMQVITREGGGSIRFSAALIRGLLFFVDGLVFGIVAYSFIARSEYGQRLGDEVAGTMVTWRTDGTARALVGATAGAVAALLWILVSYLIVR